MVSLLKCFKDIIYPSIAVASTQFCKKTEFSYRLDFAYISIIFFISAIYWGTPLAIIQNLAPQLINTMIGKIRRDDYDFILPLGYMYPFDPVKNWGRYLLVYFMQCYSSKYFHFITIND